jgi:hypothetical protein
MSEERDFIGERIKDIKNSITFFSNDLKPERELWVVNRLLDYLEIDRHPDDVKPSSDEPIDIRFRDSCFQIKEILDPHRKRTSEFKEALAKAEAAKKIEDLLENYSPPININMDDIISIIVDNVNTLTQKYPLAVRKDLDLLFYFNLLDIYIESEVIGLTKTQREQVQEAGWRSVSVVGNSFVFILYANKIAPTFIKENTGKILN